jgi:hypothetical protein
LQGESSYPGEKKMNLLQSRFKMIYTVFDIDKAGLKASNYFKEKYNTIPIYLPEEYLDHKIKDLAEIGKIEGLNRIKELIRV